MLSEMHEVQRVSSAPNDVVSSAVGRMTMAQMKAAAYQVQRVLRAPRAVGKVRASAFRPPAG